MFNHPHTYEDNVFIRMWISISGDLETLLLLRRSHVLQALSRYVSLLIGTKLVARNLLSKRWRISRVAIRYCLLYDFKRGKSAAESHRDLCDAFGQDVFSERQWQQWFHKFRFGNESLEDDARGKHPSVIDMEQLKEAIVEDPSKTTKYLANRFGCSNPTIMRCLHAIGKSSRSGQWMNFQKPTFHLYQPKVVPSRLLGFLTFAEAETGWDRERTFCRI
ncbi:hypothetical protein Y032_0088g2134 [Ancylostoma ceylanicum]|nr:hypothetical protein Y032_0088g2134 [Ancylostoma ceylanicum]